MHQSRLSDHLAASLLAAAAFFGAVLHVLVLRQLFTCLGAAGANIRTGLANGIREGAMARNNLCRGGTHVRAVAAGSQRAGVLMFAVFEHLGAMRRTAIALALTIGTCFRAGLLLSMASVMRMPGLLLCRTLGESGTFESRQGQGG